MSDPKRWCSKDRHFELRRRETRGERLWAYRYRAGGRDSKRVQRGGFTSEQDAREALMSFSLLLQRFPEAP